MNFFNLRIKRGSDEENESIDERNYNQMLANQQNKLNRGNTNPLTVKDLNKFNSNLQQSGQHQNLSQTPYYQQQHQHLQLMYQHQMNTGYSNKFNVNTSPKLEQTEPSVNRNLNSEAILFADY